MRERLGSRGTLVNDQAEIDSLIASLHAIQRLDPDVTTLGSQRPLPHARRPRHRKPRHRRRPQRHRPGLPNLHPSEETTWATSILPMARVADFRTQIPAAKQLLEKAGK